MPDHVPDERASREVVEWTNDRDREQDVSGGEQPATAGLTRKRNEGESSGREEKDVHR
jgi:hypothetical protein